MNEETDEARSESLWPTILEAARCVLWGVLWCLLVGFLVDISPIGDSWFSGLPSTAAILTAYFMARNRSLRWRYLLLRHQDELEQPIAFNEDGELHVGQLPFEQLCVIWDVESESPIMAHVHTRDLLGRNKIRSQTQWRPSPFTGPSTGVDGDE